MEVMSLVACLEKNELLAFIRKEVKKERAQEIKTHLDLCQECSEKLDQIATLMKFDYLFEYEKRKPYEGKCIPKFLLLQYVVKLADKKERKEITRHIFHCRECKRVYYSYLQVYEEVKECFEVLKDRLEAELKWSQERIRGIFRVPVEILFFPQLEPALSRTRAFAIEEIRGSTKEIEIIEEIEELEEGRDSTKEIIKETAKEGFALGACYEKLGFYQEALNIYEEIDPTNENEIVLARKIDIYRKMKDFDKANMLNEKYSQMMGRD